MIARFEFSVNTDNYKNYRNDYSNVYNFGRTNTNLSLLSNLVPNYTARQRFSLVTTHKAIAIGFNKNTNDEYNQYIH